MTQRELHASKEFKDRIFRRPIFDTLRAQL